MLLFWKDNTYKKCLIFITTKIWFKSRVFGYSTCLIRHTLYLSYPLVAVHLCKVYFNKTDIHRLVTCAHCIINVYIFVLGCFDIPLLTRRAQHLDMNISSNKCSQSSKAN